MEFNDLTEEQKAKALACKSSEELLALAEAVGIELPMSRLARSPVDGLPARN